MKTIEIKRIVESNPKVGEKMNKYQEALDKVKSIPLFIKPKEDRNGWKIYLEVSSIEEKNKTDIDVLQELVDKATPKKPKINHYGNCRGIKIICPNGCGIQLNGLGEDGESKFYTHDYCPKCGQAILWKD